MMLKTSYSYYNMVEDIMFAFLEVLPVKFDEVCS